jgi:amidase
MSGFDDYADHDGLGLAALIRGREVSPDEVIEAAIARAAAAQARVNAFVTPDYDGARAAARTPPDGPFAGVPFAVKDLWLEWAGAPHRAGSRFVRDHGFAEDAPLAAAFRGAGLISLGKTTTPEFGITGTTEPALTGPTRNPWDPERIAGGSSGGSAALVAAGVVPVAHASDGAGSIRIPAACCGLVGLKTSRGRTHKPCDALDVPFGFSSNFVVSRTVRDTAAMLDVAAQRSRYAPPIPDGGFAAAAQMPPRPLRIAASTATPSGRPVDPRIQAAFDGVVKQLEGLGHFVEEAAPQVDWRDFYKAFGSVGGAQLAADVRGLERELGRAPEADEFEPLTWRNVEAGRARSGMGLIDALRALQRFTRELEVFHERFDLILTPVLGTPLPRIGDLDPTALDPREQDRRSAQAFPFTPPFNATGQPAISLPLAVDDDGLPVGMQFAAPYGDEETLLQLAGQLEDAMPWRDRRPPQYGATA